MAASGDEVLTRLPTPGLRPYVDSYVGYRLPRSQQGLHRGLPSRNLTFIVSIGDPIDVIAQTDPRQAPARYGFVLSGLQASSALIATGRCDEGIAMGLTPLGCRAMFGMPARAVWNTSLEASDVFGRAASELRERVNLTSRWSERFAACDEVLTRLVTDTGGAAPEVGEAWRLLVATGGLAPVTEIAGRVGWGRRHLSERFRDEFGLPPKLAARVIRFERARHMLQQEPQRAIADIAAACGYFDQPHLTRDFVDLAGCPPAAWLTAEFPSVQDGTAAEPAESVP